MRTTLKLLFLFVFCSLSQAGIAQVKINPNQIGIRTLSPQFELDIRGVDNKDAGILQLGNSAADHKLLLSSGSDVEKEAPLNDPLIQWSDLDALRFATDAGGLSELMRISTDGNVGINTTDPQAKLDVNGPARVVGKLNLFKAVGDSSLFIGANAGLNSSGFNNLFIGANTGLNSSGDQNLFIGAGAGRNNTFGARNAFLGASAGISNTEGYHNTFLGYSAGSGNTTGFNNTFIGLEAGVSNTSGRFNTFFGALTGTGTTSGILNTFIGYQAGIRNKEGTRNTFIGVFADQLNFNDVLDRAIVIGYNAQANCSACAVIGGTGVDAVKVGIGTPAPSAELDVSGKARIRDLPQGAGDLVLADADGNLFRAAPIVTFRTESVEAIKAENEALQAELREVRSRLVKLENLVQLLVADNTDETVANTQTAFLTDAALLQNRPNPFRESTTIRYYIPEGVRSASLQIIDLNGKILKTIAINATGKGQTILQAQSLSAGTYWYSLVLDGEVLVTRKMVLTKN